MMAVVSLLVAIFSCAAAMAMAAIALASHKRQTRPEVITYVDKAPNGGIPAYLYVVNIGNGPAFDVDVKLPKRFHFDWEERIGVAFLERGIPFLPPGGMRQTRISTFHEFIESMGDEVLEITVSYARKRGGRKVRATFPLEGYSFQGVAVDVPKSEVVLEGIKKSASSIADSLKRIERRIDDWR